MGLGLGSGLGAGVGLGLGLGLGLGVRVSGGLLVPSVGGAAQVLDRLQVDLARGRVR